MSEPAFTDVAITVGEAMAEELEALTRQAISKHLGHRDWDAREVAPRCRWIIPFDGSFRVLEIDGIAVLRVSNRVKWRRIDNDGMIFFEVSRGHRFLP